MQFSSYEMTQFLVLGHPRIDVVGVMGFAPIGVGALRSAGTSDRTYHP
jgi:hypothetical protein